MLNIRSNERVFLGYILLIFMYPFLVLDSPEKWTLINFSIYSCAGLICMGCFRSIQDHLISSWSLFGLCYFFGFWLNTLQLSVFQVEKTVFDLYALFLGPLFFLLLLLFTEKIRVKPIKTKMVLNLNFLYLLFIALYVLITFYVHSKVGWRLEAIRNEHRIISGNEFVVPYFSGLWSVLAWSLVMLAPHVKKRYALVGILAICMFSVVLHVKRGDLIRILLFFMIYFFASHELMFKYQKSKKYIFAILITLGIILFAVLGQWRLAQSGNDAQIIVDIAGIRINSIYLAWLYSYLVVQFDVFSMSASALTVIPYQMIDLQALVSPGSLVFEDPLIAINGFNAGTTFWSFVRDYGGFFFVEMIVFWLLISFLLLLSKKTGCKGAYCFVCMLCALMVVGNYFCNRSMILAVIFSNFIYFISKEVHSGVGVSHD